MNYLETLKYLCQLGFCRMHPEEEPHEDIYSQISDLI